MKRRKSTIRQEHQRRRRQKRDYRGEYQRRIERGLARGLNRSHARGHARAGDAPQGSGATVIDPNDPRERALLRMKQGASMKAAAKAEKVSTERLRRYIKENVQATREGRRWKVIDRRGVEIAFCSEGTFRWIKVSTDKASEIGHYWVAVNRFLRTNDPSHLAPYEGKGVRDVTGKLWPFETRPNVLRRLDSAGELSFLEIYKNVA
jgi:hypothetical protein